MPQGGVDDCIAALFLPRRLQVVLLAPIGKKAVAGALLWNVKNKEVVVERSRRVLRIACMLLFGCGDGS